MVEEVVHLVGRMCGKRPEYFVEKGGLRLAIVWPNFLVFGM